MSFTLPSEGLLVRLMPASESSSSSSSLSSPPPLNLTQHPECYKLLTQIQLL